MMAIFASLLVNLALAVKIIVFDPNYPFRPICFKHNVGLVVLDGKMGEKFRKKMHTNLSNSRLSRHGILYYPYWDWWKEEELLWNITRKISVKIHEEHIGRRMTAKEYEEQEPARCTFIDRYSRM